MMMNENKAITSQSKVSDVCLQDSWHLAIEIQARDGARYQDELLTLEPVFLKVDPYVGFW